MAEPKKKLTSTRSGARKSHDRLTKLILVKCEKCKSVKPRHMVCMVCGTYEGKKIIDLDKKEQKRASKDAQETPKE